MAAPFASVRSPHTSVSQPRLSSQPEGFEGRTLNKKILKIDLSIQEDRSITINKLIQTLESSNRQGQNKLQYYLDLLRSEAQVNNEADFTVSVINCSWQVWQALSIYFARKGYCLDVPDACPGQSNNFMYTWSKVEHYLECEIFGNGEVEFFYRNRKSGEVWGEDTTVENGFSTAIFEKLSLFAC